MNCEAAGALYQDVLTTPGETLNYQLSHRARGVDSSKTEYDTMYVVIMPTKTAIENNVTTQAKVQDVINNKSNYPGAMVVEYTDADTAWTTHQGSYTVAASGQYSTRFFFVSGTTAAPANDNGEYTRGNFLDDVKFTRSKLAPVEGTANVTVEKTIVGLDYATAYNLAKNLNFQIGSKTVSGSSMSWVWSDDGNTLTGSTVMTFKESECKTDLTAAETGSLDVTDYTRTSSVTVDRTTTSGTSSTFSISTGDAETITFSNVYTANGGGSGDEPEATLSHEKYIKRNTDGTYDITLNASGTIGSITNKAKLDIVLIVDTSGSMADDDKLKNTKEAIKALVDVFNSDDKKDLVDVRYKLVTFSKNASIKTKDWVTGDTLYKSYVKGLKADGGTNYDQGLKRGAEAINSSTRTGAKKVVIFLTDGEPTYYGENAKNCGVHTSSKTLSTALNTATTIKCSDFYAVGIGLSSSINVYSEDAVYSNYTGCQGHGWWNSIAQTLSGQNILDQIKAKVNATNKDAWNLTDASTLTSKFQEIAGETLTAACTNVVITDTLSEYVDVTDGSNGSKLSVKIAEKNADNNTYTDKYSKEFTLTRGGNVIVDGKTIASVSYSSVTKTAKLTFEPSYKLKKNYYYYLTITNVIPNETAFKAYEDNRFNYGGTTGDDFTDEGGNGYYATKVADEASAKKITSSILPGFESNEKATVSYKSKDSGPTKTEEYAKPVVQVQTIPVQKVWSEKPAEGTEILVQLVDQDNKAVEGKILKLNKANNWQDSLVVEKAAKYDNYNYRELKADENGGITYEGKKYSMAENGTDVTINQISYKVTYSNTDGTRVITNTKNSRLMKIIKQSNSGTPLEGAEFTLTDETGKKISCQATDKDGIVFNNNINYGRYTLKEIKAPNGYALLNADITITVDQNGVTVSGSEKASVNKEKDGTYTIIVKNDMLYSLPSTGGSGIYWFSICGMLLMMAAAWIIYKNKCREVLVK